MTKFLHAGSWNRWVYKVFFFNAVSSVSGCLSLLRCAVPCAKESFKGKWISLGFLEALITLGCKNPKLWGKTVTCSSCPTSFLLAIQLLCCLCTSHFHCVHLLGKVLKVIFTFRLRHFRGKFIFVLSSDRHWWRLRMCVLASKSKDMLSRIFGILESLDQHNLNEFFVRKMRD